MSETYHIISDGSCDLPKELAEEKNITVVPFYVSFDDKNYLKENVEIGIRDFYQQMVDRKGVYPKSSMPSTQDYVDVFTPYARDGMPVICICITTKFSGSMQSAVNAKAIVQETWPRAEITVIDATINTVLQGLYVLEAAKLRDSGMGYRECVDRLEEIKSTGRIFFTVGDMEYLQHGGRIGKVSAVAGSVLGIRPVITLKRGRSFPPASAGAGSAPRRKPSAYCWTIWRRTGEPSAATASLWASDTIMRRLWRFGSIRWKCCGAGGMRWAKRISPCTRSAPPSACIPGLTRWASALSRKGSCKTAIYGLFSGGLLYPPGSMRP